MHVQPRALSGSGTRLHPLSHGAEVLLRSPRSRKERFRRRFKKGLQETRAQVSPRSGVDGKQVLTCEARDLIVC